MNYLALIMALLGLGLIYKISKFLSSFFDRKMRVLNCQLQIENRKLELLRDLDETIKDQEELQETYKVYTDLGDDRKCEELKMEFQKNQSKFITLKNRIV